jgi:hypothetical protein
MVGSSPISIKIRPPRVKPFPRIVILGLDPGIRPNRRVVRFLTSSAGSRDPRVEPEDDVYSPEDDVYSPEDDVHSSEDDGKRRVFLSRRLFLMLMGSSPAMTLSGWRNTARALGRTSLGDLYVTFLKNSARYDATAMRAGDPDRHPGRARSNAAWLTSRSPED